MMMMFNCDGVDAVVEGRRGGVRIWRGNLRLS